MALKVMKAMKTVRTVMKGMKSMEVKGVTVKKSKKDYSLKLTVTLDNGKIYPVPKGWGEGQCKKVNLLELKTVGLKSIFLPLTQIEQYYATTPEIYSEDATGLKRMAYIRHDNCDLDWMVNLDHPPLNY